MDIQKLDTIENTQLHRNVDTLVLAADKEGELHHASTFSPELYLTTVTRVRKGLLGYSFDDLRFCFRKIGRFGCSEHTFHPNPFGSYR